MSGNFYKQKRRLARAAEARVPSADPSVALDDLSGWQCPACRQEGVVVERAADGREIHRPLDEVLLDLIEKAEHAAEPERVARLRRDLEDLYCWREDQQRVAALIARQGGRCAHGDHLLARDVTQCEFCTDVGGRIGDDPVICFACADDCPHDDDDGDGDA